MALLKSVSGIRGTIGGKPGENLTPLDIVSFVSAYGSLLKANPPHTPQLIEREIKSSLRSSNPVAIEASNRPEEPKMSQEYVTVVVGRDGRSSGSIVKQLTISTLQSMGIDVVDLDYSTTPTVEMYVKASGANGGIIITASHNPAEWNALKFLDGQGEFISQEIGEKIQTIAETGSTHVSFATIESLGKVSLYKYAINDHIHSILHHRLIFKEVISQTRFKVVVDVINSTGSISIPPLLEALGVEVVILINDSLTGNFAHNPEPLPENLATLSRAVVENSADLGISVDPDVDRLALVDENGDFFGEEYTLVCVADYILRHKKGPVVTNLSSSMALKDLADSFGVACHFAPVGEVHVVKEMKEVGAVIGGEGNGGVIDPHLHYGRDALIGIALILMHLATSKKSLSELKKSYSSYVMVKDKIAFDPSQSAQGLLDKVAHHFKDHQLDTRDGLKVVLPESWVQLRKSNTEPILRIYAEARSLEAARSLVDQVKAVL